MRTQIESAMSKKDQGISGKSRSAFDDSFCHSCWETCRVSVCKPVEIERLKSSREFIPDRASENNEFHSNHRLKSNKGKRALKNTLESDPPDRFFETYRVAKRAGLLDLL